MASANVSTSAEDLVASLGYLLLGGLFIFAGADHAFRFHKVRALLVQRGWPVPGPLLAAASLFAAIACLGLVFGIAWAWSALALVGITVMAGVLLLDLWRVMGPEREGMRPGFTVNVGLIGGLLLAFAINLEGDVGCPNPLTALINESSDDPNLSGNFARIGTEVDPDDLPVISGRIPDDLMGAYLRNVPIHHIDQCCRWNRSFSVALAADSMIRGLILTERHLVLMIGPADFDLNAAARGEPLLPWRPDLGDRIVGEAVVYPRSKADYEGWLATLLYSPEAGTSHLEAFG